MIDPQNFNPSRATFSEADQPEIYRIDVLLRGKMIMRRKRLLSVLSLILLMAAAALRLPAGICAEAAQNPEEEKTAADSGEALWSNAYYRASDTTGTLSAKEQQALDEHCIAFMQEYLADLSLLAVTSDKYEGSTLEELADGYYEDCGFGYGTGKDGFQMVWDTASGQVVIRAYGAAAALVPQEELDRIAGSITQFEEQYGTYGPMYATVRYLSNCLSGSGGNQESGRGDAEQAEAAEPAEAPGSPAAPDAADNGSTRTTAGSPTVPAAPEDTDKTGTIPAAPEDMDGAGITEIFSGSDADRLLPDGAFPDESLRLGADAEAEGKPAWYPREPLSFPFYHDESAHRIVDLADIFTDAEEKQMETRLAELRSALGKDIVIFTDTSTYGLSHSVYAADFYDFNGYGIGPDREGVCLMVCMDPDDRGWWACCTGPVTRGLYTEEVANQIDDLLYEYMRAGDYGTGCADWIENFRRLYTTGSPYNEEWALTPKDDMTPFQDPDAPRVVDDAGILTQDEIRLLEEKVSSLSGKYGLDVIVHTALNEGILSEEEFAERYYFSHGCGTGDKYDGIMLTLFKRPNYSGRACVYAAGSGLDKLSSVNKNRLESRCTDLLLSRAYYEAASQWLDQTGHMLRTGRAPRSSASWNFWTTVELIIGAIFGAISLGRAKKKMKTPVITEHADSYLVKGSLKIRKIKDHLIDTTVSRHYSPVREERSSGGGGSGGGSSYSHSYSGSSGSSHSGSGRKF